MSVIVTPSFIAKHEKRIIELGFSAPKWTQFCLWALEEGYKVSMYEARRTVSKYITVEKGTKRYKVRFSNHKPIRRRELLGDCDFFVGITHTGTRTTEDAKKAVLAYMED